MTARTFQPLAALGNFLVGELAAFASHPLPAAPDGLVGLLAVPTSSNDAAKRLGWDAAATDRLFRALEGLGRLESAGDRRLRVRPGFEEPERDDVYVWMSDGARSSSPIRAFSELTAGRVGLENLASLRGFHLDGDSLAVLWYGRHVLSRFLTPETLTLTLQSGRCRTSVVLGLSTDQIFDHYKREPLLLASFAAAFSAMNAAGNAFAASVAGLRPGMRVLDVGGGVGGLASALATAEPGVHVDIYDHPESGEVLTPLRTRWIGSYGSRIACLYGDLFDRTTGGLRGVSEGAAYDRVFLSWILNDWSDERCADILTRTARHLAPGGEMIVLENLRTQAASRTDLADFVLFTITGGRERTLEEYERLVRDAGLRVARVEKNPAGRTLMFLRRANDAA